MTRRTLGRPGYASIWPMTCTAGQTRGISSHQAVMATHDQAIAFQKEVQLCCSEIFICKHFPGSMLPLSFPSFISRRFSLFRARDPQVENAMAIMSETQDVH